jgi:hypothetical protein
MTERTRIEAWYLNVRWNKELDGNWEEEIRDLPVELIRQIDTFLDGVEDERNKEINDE